MNFRKLLKSIVNLKLEGILLNHFNDAYHRQCLHAEKFIEIKIDQIFFRLTIIL